MVVCLLLLFVFGLGSRDLFFQSRGANQWLVNDDHLIYKRDLHHVVLVADPDMHSRIVSSPYLWKTTLLKANLKEDSDGKFSFEESTSLMLQTDVNRRGRSLELSEIVRFQHRLLAMCDYTGLVWKLRLDGGCFQRWALADGDGNHAKPFKSEWATTKGDYLFVGSNGLEWIQDGKVAENDFWFCFHRAFFDDVVL